MLALLAAALLLPRFALAQTSADSTQPPRTIEVQGQGEAQAAPDVANLSLQIETHARTAADASAKNAELAQKVIAALKAKLGERGRVSTGGYSLSPDYEQHNGMNRPTIIGYNAQNSVSVETGALDLAGPLIDIAIAAGANRVNDLSFDLKDNTHVRAEAIAAASRDAQTQAAALAQSLGVRLGKIVKASTVSEPRPVPVMMRSMAANVSATTPIEPGQLTVPATVFLTYEIE
ncbi:MAG TPA: SIMPL domain-containing protein [Candidatus Binataceae bacterium]|nr:SIMPL domain-containing protein [Candidatus Binataceae bacterium]